MNENKEYYKKEKRKLVFKIIILFILFVGISCLLSFVFYVLINKFKDNKIMITSISNVMGAIMGFSLYFPMATNILNEYKFWKIRETMEEANKIDKECKF